VPVTWQIVRLVCCWKRCA